MSNLKYRADIDGLRAIAVLMVVLFHMNADWIPGGFIGVDIFFVISGYIITSAIYPQIVNKEFSFNQFYVKRIKRILPLFYLVAMTSLVFAYWLYTPNDFMGFADSLRYASTFIANVYFENTPVILLQPQKRCHYSILGHYRSKNNFTLSGRWS